jgi:hypothetical protein
MICWAVDSAVGCSVTLKCSTEMQHAPTLMRQHHEYEQDPQPHSGNGKEVDRD